ncbi:MAG TPA: rRNA adenine N-6-methyltransferase family protein [Caulobacteraceae bacterium]|nr:rRNA adenine N-6-methyltransferase family protein [Caulobacteraceae bacterium]
MSGAQRTRSRLAQNFFAADAPARLLAAALPLSPGEWVYDLGAGAGALTAALLRHDVRVVAVERDPNLARKLRARFAGRAVTVVEADLRQVALRAPYKVVANPPFNATADLMRRLLHGAPPPDAAALVLQRQAADKYGGIRPNAAALAALPRFGLDVTRPFSRRDFVPAPSVDVALLRLRRKDPPDLAAEDEAEWRAFVRYVFARPRPDAWRSLRGLVSNLQWRRLCADLGIEPDAMRADLSYAQWLGVFHFVRRCVPAAKLAHLHSA